MSKNTRSDSRKTTRPALERLELDIVELIEGSEDVPGLRGGFEDRSELVEWEQRLAVRTLGEVPQDIFLGMGQQLASPKDRPIVQIFLKDSSLDDETARHWRKRVRKNVVQRGFDLAYKKLRSGAAEYNTEDANDDIDPEDLENLGMRPALSKVDTAQHSVLIQLLNGGFKNPDEIMDWGLSLEHATYGESIRIPGRRDIPIGKFISILHRRDPWAELLIQDRHQRGREAFAARVLVPAFNHAVRVLAGHSGEFLDEPTNEDQGVSVDV